MSFFQAIVIGVLQGITELFPISSLGHSVLLPAWLGWDQLTNGEAADKSFYLTFLVGLHVATAIALVIFFRSDWVRIIRGFFTSVRDREVATPDQKMAWLLVLATVPVGVVGLVAEHGLRTLFAKPLAASIFLTINGGILIAGERLRKRASTRPKRADTGDTAGAGETAEASLGDGTSVTTLDAAVVGTSQIAALFAGISRSGATMVGGLLRGLDHEDAARFSFLLATPVIFAAGLYKLPDLFGPLGNGIRGQVLVGSAVAFVAAYFSVRFLTKFFHTRTLLPFAVYCLVAGAASIIRFH